MKHFTFSLCGLTRSKETKTNKRDWEWPRFRVSKEIGGEKRKHPGWRGAQKSARGRGELRERVSTPKQSSALAESTLLNHITDAYLAIAFG